MTPRLHYLIHVFGWTLLHLCWQAILIALLLACVLSLLANKSPRLRYAFSCCALALIVSAFAITSYRVAVNAKSFLNSPVTFSSDTETLAYEAVNVQDSFANKLQHGVEKVLPSLLLLWSTGFLLFGARLNFGLFLSHRLRSTGISVPSAEHLQIFRSIAHRLNVTQHAKLLRSTAVNVPVVIGWLRPVVLMPATTLTGLSSEQLEAIFAHELAHIRRHDYLVSVLQSLVESLLFFHPAVWWISHQIRKERELCCDDIAVETVRDPVLYARALYQLAEHRFTCNHTQCQWRSSHNAHQTYS